MNTQRITCPHCLQSAWVRLPDRWLKTLLVLGNIASCAAAAAWAGMPDVVRAWNAGQSCTRDEYFAFVLAFLCIWLIFLGGLVAGAACWRYRRAWLEPAPDSGPRWLIPLRRLILRSPYSLRCLFAALNVALIGGVLLATLPRCTWRTLVWEIDRTGAVANAQPAPLFQENPESTWFWPAGPRRPASIVVTISAPRPPEQVLQILEALRRLPGSKALQVPYQELSPDAATAISRIPGLHSLAIHTQQFTDADVQRSLTTHTQLAALDLQSTSITDDSLPTLMSLKSLKNLHLGYTQIRGRSAAGWPPWPELQRLDLSGAPLDDDALRWIATLPRLRSLSLSYTPVTDAGIRLLSQAKSLTSLDLRNTQITDAAIDELAQLPGLSQLNVVQTVITADGIARLKQLHALEIFVRQ